VGALLGNTAQAVVVIDPAALNTLPDVLRRNTWQQSRPMFIDLNRWSFDELQVPIYPNHACSGPSGDISAIHALQPPLRW